MKTIHLMVGIQGSGKTTLAKKLSSALVAKIVSTDEVRKTFPRLMKSLSGQKCMKCVQKN